MTDCSILKHGVHEVTQHKIPLAGSERTPLPGFQVLHKVDPASIVNFTLVLRPPPGDQTLELLQESGAILPRERHYPTREEYAQAHGADPADVAKVLQFAAQYDLKVDSVNKAARSVLMSGTAAAICQAFNLDLFVYQGAGPQSVQHYRGRTGPIYIPAELEGIVEAVMGLDDRPQAESHPSAAKADV